MELDGSAHPRNEPSWAPIKGPPFRAAARKSERRQENTSVHRINHTRHRHDEKTLFCHIATMNPKDFRTKCLAASVLALFVWFQPCEGFLDDGRSRNDVRDVYWETAISPKWSRASLEKNLGPFDDAACDTRKTLLPLTNTATGFKRTTQERSEGNLNRNKDFSSNFDKGRNHRSRQGTLNDITTERERSMRFGPKHTSSDDVRNLQLNENEKLASATYKPTPRIHQSHVRLSNEVRNGMRTDDQNRNTKTTSEIRNRAVRNPIRYRNQRGTVEDGNIREVPKESRNVRSEVKRNVLEPKHESVLESKERDYRNSHGIESTPTQHGRRNARLENEIITRSVSRNDENVRGVIFETAERRTESRTLDRERQRGVWQQNVERNFNLDENLRRSNARRSTRESTSVDVRQHVQTRMLDDVTINENREVRLSTRSDMKAIVTRSIARRGNEERKSNTEARKENTDVRRERSFRVTRNGEELQTNVRNVPKFERANLVVSGDLHRSSRRMSEVRQTGRVKNEVDSTARDGTAQESHGIRYVTANNGKSDRRTAEDVVVTLHDIRSREVKYRRNSERSSDRMVVKTHEDRRRIRDERKTDTNPERIQRQDKEKREVNQRTRSSSETRGDRAHHRNNVKSRIEETERGLRNGRDVSRNSESGTRTNSAGRDVNNNIVRDDRQRWSRDEYRLERTTSRISENERVRRQVGRTSDDVVEKTNPGVSNNVRETIQTSGVVEVDRTSRSVANNVRERTHASRAVGSTSRGGNRREMAFSRRESQVVGSTLTDGNPNQRLTRSTNVQGVRNERGTSEIRFRRIPENDSVDRTRDVHRTQLRSTTSRGTSSIDATNRKDTDRAQIPEPSNRKIQERTRENSQSERNERRSTLGEFGTRYVFLIGTSHRYQHSEVDRRNGKESSRTSLERARGITGSVQSRKQSSDRDISRVERTQSISATRSARNEHTSSNDNRRHLEAHRHQSLDENRRRGKQDERTSAGKRPGDVQTQRRALGLGVREGTAAELNSGERSARQRVTARRPEENSNVRRTSRRLLRERADDGDARRSGLLHDQVMGTKKLSLYHEIVQVFSGNRNGWVNFLKTLLTSLVLMQVVAKANVKQYR